MKKTKVLLTLACAVLLVAASVMGTLAYLTSTAEVKNTFTVGKVELKNGDNGAGLDEAKTNTNGQPVNNQGTVVELKDAPRVQANEYKLMPGHTYTKDPTVHVAAGSENCWIFVTVKNDIAALEADSNSSIHTQIGLNHWVYGGKTNDGASLYYRKHTSSDEQVDYTVFSNFKIADNADTLDVWKNVSSTTETKDGTLVLVTAYAIQMDGFENDMKGAWAAVSNNATVTWLNGLESGT